MRTLVRPARVFFFVRCGSLIYRMRESMGKCRAMILLDVGQGTIYNHGVMLSRLSQRKTHVFIDVGYERGNDAGKR